MTQLSVAVLDRLAHLSVRRDVPSLGDRLAALDRWVRDDLATLERDLEAIPKGERIVHAAAHHLLELRGKHLRPTCVALAARFGEGFTPRARSLAVAVELVHSATLLHDDVVDVAAHRRGQPTACVVYGNAASIFAGDWLLVAALRRIASTNLPGLLDHMLAVIDEMIVAESIQLERRGHLTGTREDYFAIAEGKTAALFRWAMVAGARSAELPAACEAALDRFGLNLGVAFQAIDDELDFSEASPMGGLGGEGAGRARAEIVGDDVSTAGTGKDPLVDLREGKLTFPLVVALERAPALRGQIEALLGEDSPPRSALIELAGAIRATGALDATRALAEERVQRALEELEHLPAGPARDALVTVALASLQRVS